MEVQRGNIKKKKKAGLIRDLQHLHVELTISQKRFLENISTDYYATRWNPRE